MSLGVRAAIAAAVWSVAVLGHAAPPPMRTYEDCEALLAEQPERRQPYSCIYRVGRINGTLETSRERFEALAEADPDNPWPRYGLSNVLVDLGDRRAAEPLVSKVAAELDDYPHKDAMDQVTVHLDLGLTERDLGSFSKARAALRRAGEVAEEAGLEELAAMAKIERASLDRALGAEQAEVRRLLGEALPVIEASGDYTFRLKAYNAAAMVEMWSGDVAEARRYREKILDLAVEHGDTYVEAAMRGRLLLTRMDEVDLRDLGDVSEIRRDARALVELAERAGNPHTKKQGMLALAYTEADRAASVAAMREVVALEESLGRPNVYIETRHDLLVRLVMGSDEERAEALRLAKASVEQAATDGTLGCKHDSAADVAIASWANGDLEEAVRWGERAIEVADLIRDVQVDDWDRVLWLEVHASTYYQLSGNLLEHGTGPADVQRSFEVAERLRARTLLERLDAADVDVIPPDDPRAVARQQTLTEISRAQKKLLLADLSDDERNVLLEELEELEDRERAQRLELARSNADFAELRMQGNPPALTDVQARLAPHEAILAYQIADVRNWKLRPEGGAWVLVITKDAVTPVSIVERRLLQKQIPMVSGLVEARDGSELPALGVLYDELLADALAVVPEEVTSLTVVPDGLLYDVPFAALRPSPQAEPLASRFALTMAPSVTSMMKWRARPPASSGRVLALGLSGLGTTVASRDGGTLQTGVDLGRLERAEEEVRAIAEIVGDADVRIGNTATERSFKTSAFEDLGVVHFATHAIMDRDHPERSAVVLASASDDEDGLLQVREIVGLPLDGKVVVLSACSGATGTAIRGEGVMSLARAFLYAGADAVVASQWPLDDNDALLLFQRLYTHLDAGMTLAEALAHAQREMAEAGAPVAAWGGVVVLGRGDLVVRPDPGLKVRIERFVQRRRDVLLVVSGLVVLLGLAMAWTRRPRP